LLPSCDGHLDKPKNAQHSETMGKMDQGLGAIGLILLTVALALVFTLGVPISVSRETVELKDWLGFAGNVVGALMTLVAAIVAWRAVQRQITVQREANLLVLMTREEDRLETEFHAVEICLELLTLALWARIMTKGPSSYVAELSSLGFSSDEIETRRLVQQKVAGPIPPSLLSKISSLMTAVIRAATIVRSLHIDDNGEIRKDTPANRRQTADANLHALEDEMDRLSSDLTVRRNSLTDVYLPGLRSRIEAGLHG
jgi:hypothetical protein